MTANATAAAVFGRARWPRIGQVPSAGCFASNHRKRSRRWTVTFILSNGLGWSPDNRTMYFTDFGRRLIYAYDFDADTGAVTKRRPFIEIPQDAGFPDGMTIDAEGCLWVAHWDGWRVTRYGPDGKPRQTIRMPVKRPTSCTFGGPDLSDTLRDVGAHGIDRNGTRRGSAVRKRIRHSHRHGRSRRAEVFRMTIRFDRRAKVRARTVRRVAC